MKKRPDQFVDNPMSLPYPTNVGAPAFTVPNVLLHKDERTSNAAHHFETRFDEIKTSYYELVSRVQDTELVYGAEYNFIPIVGRVYHLYVGPTGKLFLSLIEPAHWTMEFKGSFKFTSDNTWERQ